MLVNSCSDVSSASGLTAMISTKLLSGRYRSLSEAVCTALRLHSGQGRRMDDGREKQAMDNDHAR